MREGGGAHQQTISLQRELGVSFRAIVGTFSRCRRIRSTKGGLAVVRAGWSAAEREGRVGGCWYLRRECADWFRDGCQFRVDVGIVMMSHEHELEGGRVLVWCGVVRTSTVNDLAADGRWFSHGLAGMCVSALCCAVLSCPPTLQDSMYVD